MTPSIKTSQFIPNKSSASFWILAKYYNLEQHLKKNLSSYELAHSIDAIYKFLWDNFADWYIEYLKTDDSQINFAKTLFRQFIITASPYCPFETEVLWKEYFDETELLADFIKDDSWSANALNVEFGVTDFHNLEQDTRYIEFENVLGFIGNVRSLKGLFAIDPVIFVEVFTEAKLLLQYSDYIKLLGRTNLFNQSKADLYNVVDKNYSYQIDILQYIKDKTAEITRTTKIITDLNKQITQLETQLSNTKFVQNAEPEVILEKQSNLVTRKIEIQQQNDKLDFLNIFLNK
jgi:valyl-tRNA synthetase